MREREREKTRLSEEVEVERERGSRASFFFVFSCWLDFSQALSLLCFFLTSDTPNAVAALASDPTLCFFETLCTTR